MKVKWLASWTAAALLLQAGPISSPASEVQVCRVVSTQATEIVSFDGEGNLSWSNSVLHAECRVEWAPMLPGAWSDNPPSLNVVATSTIAVVQIPMTSDEIFTEGTVRYIALEGGFYGIRGDDGHNYDPINLPREFRVDGKRIVFGAMERPDLGSFHMWGIIIELLQIEEI